MADDPLMIKRFPSLLVSKRGFDWKGLALISLPRISYRFLSPQIIRLQ